MDDMLSSILNDPEKLQSAISMASSMLGGGAAEAAPAAGTRPYGGACQMLPAAAPMTHLPS